jgi:hypothetical protein
MNINHVMGPRRFGVALAIIAIHPSGAAQEPVIPSPAPQSPVVQLPAYRLPALALVQPAAGGNVPSDKPVVVFRFAPGEPNDPIDVRSFAVGVDGHDRTHLFQVNGGEAWGPLAPPDAESALEPGSHEIAARICSSRGACADVSATVLVVPSVVPIPRDDASSSVRCSTP